MLARLGMISHAFLYWKNDYSIEFDRCRTDSLIETSSCRKIFEFDWVGAKGATSFFLIGQET